MDRQSDDVVGMIQLVGVDLREVFDENGTIITFEAKQQRIQQQVIERLIGLGVEIPDDVHGQLLEEGRVRCIHLS